MMKFHLASAFVGLFHNVSFDKDHPLSVNTIAIIIANIIQLLFALGAALAVVIITYSGIRYASSQGDAGQIKEAKSAITNSIVGLLLSSAAFLIVDFVAKQFDSASTISGSVGSTATGLGLPAISLDSGVRVAVDLLSIATGIISVLFLVIGGIKYASSNGNSKQVEDGKRTITYAIVGLIISILAATIVSFVVSHQAQ